MSENEERKQAAANKRKKRWRRFWRKNGKAVIAASVFALAVLLALLSILFLQPGNAGQKDSTEEQQLASSRQPTLGVSKDGMTTDTVSTESGNSAVAEGESASSQEEEDPCVLSEQSGTASGYLNHCVFLGDSRTVGMVNYRFISDADALAQVGIAHTSAESFTYTQNSGKQYTIKSYLAARQPEVIYIGYGVNGMNGLDEASYESTYTKLIRHIIEMSPQSKVVLMAIWPVNDEGTYKGSVKNEWIDKYNLFLKQLAADTGMYYLAVNNVLKNESGGIRSEYDAGDGLHYNTKAYEVILDYIISHPVPGISDEGEYVVHYVAPRPQNNIVITTPTPAPTVAETVEEEPSPTVTPSPSPTVSSNTPTPTPTKKATPTPTPTGAEESPTPTEGEAAEETPTPTGGEATEETPTPTEGEAAEETPTPTEEAAEETPSPTEEAEHTPTPAEETQGTPTEGTESGEGGGNAE